MSDASPAESTIVIRDVRTINEVHAVEALQKEVWGGDDLDVVPLSQLVAAREVGGILVAAFDGEKMAGFAFGFVGYENREAIGADETLLAPFSLGRPGQALPVIHSHMLAVKPEYRSLDLGYKLKLAQRDRALMAGFSVMTWTFDPLQCLNAHFNFTKLGVVSDTYKINFYGAQTSSFLHQNGTDRLWVNWLLSSPRVIKRLNAVQCENLENSSLTTLVSMGEDNVPVSVQPVPKMERPTLAIEIPWNISEIGSRDPGLSIAWREATRAAFTEALGLGYLVTDFHRRNRDGNNLGYYVLTPRKSLADIA